MKIRNLNLKPLLLGVVMIVGLASCNSGGNEDGRDAAPVDGVAEPGPTPVGAIEDGTLGLEAPAFLQEYADIKNALFNDNYEQAKQAAVDFQNALEETDDQLPAAHKGDLKQSAGKLAQAKDIAAQREQFAALSQQLYQLVQANDITNQKLYWQHCPMAMNGKGANWLSMEEKVQNPFMGQKMPACGSVQETL